MRLALWHTRIVFIARLAVTGVAIEHLHLLGCCLDHVCDVVDVRFPVCLEGGASLFAMREVFLQLYTMLVHDLIELLLFFVCIRFVIIDQERLNELLVCFLQ